jgi:hypothetical protein
VPLVSIFGAAGWYFELGPCTQPPLCRWSRLTEPHIGPWVRVFSPVSLGPALSIPFSYRFHLARYQPATNAKAPPPETAAENLTTSRRVHVISILPPPIACCIALPAPRRLARLPRRLLPAAYCCRCHPRPAPVWTGRGRSNSQQSSARS